MKTILTDRIPVKLVLVGLSLTFMFLGCSSRQHTAVMSGEEAPPKQEMVEPSEPTPEPEPEIAGAETVTPEEDLGPGPEDIEVEEPARALIRPEAPPEALETPLESPMEVSPRPIVKETPETAQEEVGETKTEPTDLVEGIPPIEIEPELPPEPDISVPSEPSKPPEIARLTPEVPVQEPDELSDIFFDYDQFTIRQDAITTLEADARFLLAKHPEQTIIIEGHCDERGTEEYNIVLGERRAQAVKDYLVDLGVPEENLQVISYGKEKPFCAEHSLKCWQQNRRGHFVLQ